MNSYERHDCTQGYCRINLDPKRGYKKCKDGFPKQTKNKSEITWRRASNGIFVSKGRFIT